MSNKRLNLNFKPACRQARLQNPKSQIPTLIFLFAFWLFFSGIALAVGTVAGTSIEIGSAKIYHDLRVSYSENLSLLVSQDYGLNLAAPKEEGSVSPGSSYFFPHTLTNVGNGSDQYRLELSRASSGWSSGLVRDDNRNGIHESSETTPVENPVSLAEDAAYYFFVVITAPEHAADAPGKTTLTASGSVDDGRAYLGANGSFYGGPDSISSPVHAKLVRVDMTPPVISNLIINGRKRFAKEAVSSRLKIEASILDDKPGNVAKIEIWMNDSLKFHATSEDWVKAYDEGSGRFAVELPALKPDAYLFKIIVWDKAGNRAVESIFSLFVNPS